jgi:hypothetical protein
MSNFKKFREIKKGEQFYAGADTSMGLNDYCVCQFFSSKHLDVPMVYRVKAICGVMTNELLPIFNHLSELTGYNPLVAYERQNGGAFELDRLAGLNKHGKFDIYKAAGEDGKLGWDTNTATRPSMLANLKDAIDNRLIRVYDKVTIEEMFSFVKVQTSTSVKAQAENNSHDDCVMSLAIAYGMYLQYPDLSMNKTSYQRQVENYQRSINSIERNGY